MKENKKHNEIYPKLESILKEELRNRAEKLQKIEEWKSKDKELEKEEEAERRTQWHYAQPLPYPSPSKEADIAAQAAQPTSNRRILGIALIGTIVYAVVGITGTFLMLQDGREDIPELVGDGAVEQINDGNLVDPTIIDAIESGNNEAAIRMIDSCLLECKDKLANLDTLTITQEKRQEYEEQMLMLKQEMQELDSLKSSLH